MAASKAGNKNEEGTLKDERTAPIFIHSTIDDMTGLSPNTMRVYMHLARRAQGAGVAWPSYQSVGDHCFSSVSENPATRKSFARKAIAQLIEAKLLVKEERARDDGGQTSNAYVLVNPPCLISTPVLNKHDPCLIDTPHAYKAPEDTPIEDTPLKEGDEEDTHARDPVHAAWFETFGEEMPPKIEKAVLPLVVECGMAAVIHGIRESVNAESRSFKYIASCARNYIPAANNGYSQSYQVDLPPAKPIAEIAPRAAPPVAAPSSLAALWMVALAELIPTLPGVAASYLTGSRLQEGDSVDDVPLLTLVLEARVANGISWLSVQAGPAIRRKLTSLLGHPVLVEMSCEGES